jgi:hypothetical protein
MLFYGSYMSDARLKWRHLLFMSTLSCFDPMHFNIISKNMFWTPNLSLNGKFSWEASHCHSPKNQVSKNVYQGT